MSGQLAQKVRAKYPGAYDDLSDEQLEKAVSAKYPGVYDDLIEKNPTSPPRSVQVHPHARVGRAVIDYAKGAGRALTSIPSAIHQTVTDPIGTATGLLTAPGNLMQQSVESFRRGEYGTAARKGVNAVIPIVGPMIDAAQEQGTPEAMGELSMNAALMAYGARPRTTTTASKPPRVSATTNPVEAAAVQFAKQEGIPLDAGTATGRQFIKNVQKKAASSYGGANTAEALQSAQADNLARVGGRLATDAGPRVMNPVSAGEGVQQAITKVIQDEHAKANAAYTKLRDIEKTSTPDLVRARNTGAGADDFADMQLAIDLRGFRDAMRPQYERLLKKKELTGTLMGSEGRALVTLDSIMSGPDFAPLSQVDAALSDIKAIARKADMPELRDVGQGISAKAVQLLDAQVRARANRAGADAIQALEQGRAATRSKYAAAEVLDLLSGEPGQVFRQLTQNKDVGLERLKAVQKIAPNEMPNVARAFLEDMLQQATAEGGFIHADRLYANWQKLGRETKQRLFPKQGQIQALDHYFLIAKRIKENPNPSGTAQVMNATNLLAGVPMWALSKMLMTPRGVKWLTDARVVSKSTSPAARTLALSNLSKAAQSAGVPLDAIPAFAEGDQPPMPAGRRP